MNWESCEERSLYWKTRIRTVASYLLNFCFIYNRSIMVELFDDSHLRENISTPVSFPMKEKIMAIFSRYGYHNEDIAWKVSKAIPWTKLEGYEKYDELLEIAEAAIDMRWSCSRCIIGGRDLSAGAQERLSASVLCYLEKNLCKWYSSNFKCLESFSWKESRNVGFNGLPTGGIMNQRHLLFLMHKYLMERFAEDYFTAPMEQFQEAMKDTYNYIRNHPDEMPIIGSSESILFGRWRSDLDLFEACRFLLKNKEYNNKQDIESGKRRLRQQWSFWLGQGATTLMLQEFELAVHPIYLDDEMALDPKTDPKRHLPYPIDSPQYRYVKELHRIYGVSFNESFLIPAHTFLQGLRHSTLPKAEKKGSVLAEWGSNAKSKYLITQYLYYSLTGDLIAPKGGGHCTLMALIFDLLVLFGYRNDFEEKEKDLKDPKDIQSLRRDKKDSVKRFISVDRTTGIYERLQ